MTATTNARSTGGTAVVTVTDTSTTAVNGRQLALTLPGAARTPG